MLAWMDAEAERRTRESGEAWFWSRSRQEYWHKGETSGNTMAVEELRDDCDGDALLLRVRPNGPACHTGSRSCFDEPFGLQQLVGVHDRCGTQPTVAGELAHRGNALARTEDSTANGGYEIIRELSVERGRRAHPASIALLQTMRVEAAQVPGEHEDGEQGDGHADPERQCPSRLGGLLRSP